MTLLSIVLLIALLLVAVIAIGVGVWYEVYYKPSKIGDSVNVPETPQGSLISGSDTTS